MKIKIGSSVYPLDYDELTNVDVMDLEALVGMPIGEWQQTLTTGGALPFRTVTVLVWIARRQNGEPDLRFGDVRFKLGEIDLVPEPGDEPADEAADATGPPVGSSGVVAEPSTVVSSGSAATSI
jgi:hypothetical protein